METMGGTKLDSDEVAKRSLLLTILALVAIEPDEVPPASCMATNSSRDFNDRWTAAFSSYERAELHCLAILYPPGYLLIDAPTAGAGSSLRANLRFRNSWIARLCRDHARRS